MGYFDDIDFAASKDGSICLYDKKAGDIFHSETGALKEAYDKFISPLKPLFSNFPENLNILDICYGIGYNTKAAFETLKNFNLKIDALEYNKELVYLSPFINDKIDNDDLKMFLLSEIYNSGIDYDVFKGVFKHISGQNFKQFISAFTMPFIEGLNTRMIENTHGQISDAFLHNIYYLYISSSMKNCLKTPEYKDSCINFFFGDARKSILKTNNKYDIIFLDAFSPKKTPELWTIDFLAVLKSKMKQNSVLISYSKSSPFRSALLELGFYAGKTFAENIEAGTIASDNPDFILNKLSKDDIDILNTRSGIPYRDKNLSSSAAEILLNRKLEADASYRLSRTQYEKMRASSFQ